MRNQDNTKVFNQEIECKFTRYENMINISAVGFDASTLKEGDICRNCEGQVFLCEGEGFFGKRLVFQYDAFELEKKEMLEKVSELSASYNASFLKVKSRFVEEDVVFFIKYLMRKVQCDLIDIIEETYKKYGLTNNLLNKGSIKNKLFTHFFNGVCKDFNTYVYRLNGFSMVDEEKYLKNKEIVRRSFNEMEKLYEHLLKGDNNG